MSAQQKPLILVDGSSYLYRAFHALPQLMNSNNVPTGATYGIISMLKRLMADYSPTNMAVIFDAKGKTFRHALYPDYKANRADMPAELVQQIEPIHRIIQAMGIPLIMIEGVEADDVIGTLATTASTKKIATLISTGDKDLAQLVNQHITLINTMTNTVLNPDEVKVKFGVSPEQIIDYLTLMGDSSDNIPGVPNVGPKTAAKWLAEYGSLDNIIKNADAIKGKVGDNLRAFLPQIMLSKNLVTIKRDVDLALHLSQLELKPADDNALIALFQEYEFKTWLAELLTHPEQDQTTKYENYVIIQSESELQQWVSQLQKAACFAFDTETTSLDYMRAELVGVSFAIDVGKSAYVPFGHDYPDAPKQLAKEVVLNTLKPVLENPAIKKIGQNIKYDIEVLANAGIKLQGIAFDTMLESYLLDSASRNHDMDTLALKYLGWKTIHFTDIAGKGSKQVTFNCIDVATAGRYAAEDADVTLQLHQHLWPRLCKEHGLQNVFVDIEMPLVSVLAKMERTGVLVDPETLKTQGIALQKRLDEIEQTIFLLAGGEFNINSTKQLQEVLFQQLKLPILQKTPGGQPSTADAVLQELAHDFELPHLIIEYRSLSKLISTYTSRLIAQINPETGRIHTSYNQAGTSTGRLSSSEPNLQNIPIRSPEGRRIRQAFIAAKGHKLISADYSQVELRLMAHISQDSNLMQAFLQDIDIHQATAAEVAGVALDQVTPEMRRDAKAVNFGLIYGISAFGLTQQLGIDRKTAQAYIDRYFARYPQVKNYMDETRVKAKERGYVETLWGRRLYLPDINASQIPRQKAAERIAINAPLQGSAADIIKLAMIHIDQWLTTKKINAKMIMQVHDELVFEVREADVDDVVVHIRDYMTNVVKLSVPLQVSVGIGDNWDQASDH